MEEHPHIEEKPLVQIPEEIYIKICDFIKEDVLVFGIA